MLHGDHQIFCNIISSDMELSINIGKLHETMKKEENKRKENCDTSHFKLQIDLVWGEGENRFGAELIGKWQHLP